MLGVQGLPCVRTAAGRSGWAKGEAGGFSGPALSRRHFGLSRRPAIRSVRGMWDTAVRILALPFVEKVGLVVVSALTSALVNRFFNRKARRQAAKDRAELAAIRRRGEAPFFRPITGKVWELVLGLQARLVCSPGNPAWLRVLDGTRAEIKRERMKDGDHVLLIVENIGLAPRTLEVEPNTHEIKFYREPNMEGADKHCWFGYPYRPEEHGKDQSFVITFETETGVQGKHTYVLKHGVRELRRIDPA